MTSLNKKFFKFLSIFTILSYSLYGFNSYAQSAIEREAREYSLSVGEAIQDIQEDAQEQQRKLIQENNQLQNIQLQNSRELTCLTDNIYYEAGNQSVRGKMAVAAVTLNRVRSSKFPSTICSVVHQRRGRVCQFSWTCMRKYTPNPRTYAESRDVAEQVLFAGADAGFFAENVLFYHADYINPGWNLRRVTKIGNHIFYAG